MRRGSLPTPHSEPSYGVVMGRLGAAEDCNVSPARLCEHLAAASLRFMAKGEYRLEREVPLVCCIGTLMSVITNNAIGVVHVLSCGLCLARYMCQDGDVDRPEAVALNETYTVYT